MIFYMKCYSFLQLALAGSSYSISQDSNYIDRAIKFQWLIHKADSLNNEHNYYTAGKYYDSAFFLMGNLGFFYDQFRAAKNWLSMGEKDKCLKYVELIPKSRYFSLDDKVVIYNHIKNDSLFFIIHNEKVYHKVLHQLASIKINQEKKYNKALSIKLDSIFINDQFERSKIDTMIQLYGRNSIQLKELWKKINYNDSINVSFVTHLLQGKGWLGEDVVGKNGLNTIFLVIQHANINIQKKYFASLKKIAFRGGGDLWNFAYLADRIQVQLGRSQSYGSQFYFNTQMNVNTFYPIRDERHLNMRRYKVGLEPIEYYAKKYNIKRM